MADDYTSFGKGGLSAPLRRIEISTHAAADHTLAKTTRALFCGIDGELTVDTPHNTQILIQVIAGWNPIRIKKIYKTASDVIVVNCWD